MKREIAAISFFALLSVPAFAGPIETSELPPPEFRAENDSLRGSVGDSQSAQKPDAGGIAHDDWYAYSSAELWLEGIPETGEISLEAIARRNRLNPAYADVQRDPWTLPTSYEWNRGNWKAKFGTNVTAATATPTVVPTELYAGNITSSGGTGEFKSRVEYDLNTWQFYGGTQRSIVANADGTISVNNNFTGGTYYRLPDRLLGGKVGTGFEVNPVGDAKTRLEYRQVFGDTEGFIAAERIAPFQHVSPDATGASALKAGINRKF